MENPEEVLQLLERFTKLKQKEIPRELDDYLSFVARTGDTVYRWAIVKHLFREKLVHVITDFHDNTPSIADLPQCPNVDPFNYERMKRILLERLDAFNSAPFTVQRICELLTEPRKQYTRIDKYMRAVEKNILVVSTQEPGRRRSESENGDSLDSIVNGDLEVNVDIEMDNEAFGIDSGEIVPSSAAVVSSEPVAPSSQEEEQTSRVAEPEVSKEAAEAVPVEATTLTTEPATGDKEAEAKEEEPGDEPVTVNPSAEDGQSEAAIPKDDSKPEEDNKETAELVVSHPAEEPSTVEELPVPEEQPVVPTEPDSINDPKESHDIAKDLPDGSESGESKVETASDSADDGQPAPKLAKLSDEPVAEPEPEPEQTTPTPVVAADSLEAEKDDVSSGSTTDSGGSSASVESEPAVSTTSSTDSSTPAEPESESTDRLAQDEQQQSVAVAVETLPEPEKEQPVSCEPVSDSAVPTPEIAPCGAAAPVVVEEPAPVEAEPTVKESIEEPAVGVEMETAAAVLVPEHHVMATDEEDTLQSPVDAVVPMAADVPEATKPDDNAMDVDESSVEPMEDQ